MAHFNDIITVLDLVNSRCNHSFQTDKLLRSVYSCKGQETELCLKVSTRRPPLHHPLQVQDWAQGRAPAGVTQPPLTDGATKACEGSKRARREPPDTPQRPPSQTHPQRTPHTRTQAAKSETAHGRLRRLTPHRIHTFRFQRPFRACPAEMANPRRQFTGKVRSHAQAFPWSCHLTSAQDAKKPKPARLQAAPPRVNRQELRCSFLIIVTAR